MAILGEDIVRAKNRKKAWNIVKNKYRIKVRKDIQKENEVKLVCRKINQVGKRALGISDKKKYYQCLLKEK